MTKTNLFAETWKKAQEKILTENGAVTLATSGNANVDLFFQIGALRGQPVERVYSAFSKAFAENPYIATRILLWSRDVRGGAGERKIFRDLLLWLENNEPDVLSLVIPKIPEIGRFDDLLIFRTKKFQDQAFEIYEANLRAKNGLAAKWAPREGSANKSQYIMLRNYLGLTPYQYRKVITKLTDVVETKMCAKDWKEINYNHVPSVAQARYKKAFLRHDPVRYSEYGKNLVKALSDPELAKTVKVNAGAVYPYDVLKGLFSGNYYSYASSSTTSNSELNVIRAQWAALPDYMKGKNILPIIDVSGSMTSQIPGTSITCMQVAVSIGLYMATKNKGAFNKIFMTFSSAPQMVALASDDIVENVRQTLRADWGGSTNIDAALIQVLSHAKTHRIPQSELPEYLVVLSDMEFDYAGKLTAYEKYKKDFASAGYRAPTIVWWNIQSRQAQSPVKYNAQGTALVSGFSPSIAKSILGGEDISPVNMMLRVIMNERYDVSLVKNAA